MSTVVDGFFIYVAGGTVGCKKFLISFKIDLIQVQFFNVGTRARLVFLLIHFSLIHNCMIEGFYIPTKSTILFPFFPTSDPLLQFLSSYLISFHSDLFNRERTAFFFTGQRERDKNRSVPSPKIQPTFARPGYSSKS